MAASVFIFIEGVFACALLNEPLFAVYAVKGHSWMHWAYGYVFCF
jgi:hypothetical protein